MSEAIRTRCKFRVVGVEKTDHIITEPVYEDADKAAYNALESAIWNDSKGNYKNRVVGLSENVRLVASYDSSNPEDVSFAAATPSGELKIYVSNPKVLNTFTPGQSYYLDLIPCD